MAATVTVRVSVAWWARWAVRLAAYPLCALAAARLLSGEQAYGIALWLLKCGMRVR